MSCESCQLSQRMAKAEESIEQLQHDRNEANVKDGRMELTLEYIKIAVDNLTKKVEKMAEAPKKRWDVVINTAIAGVVAAIVAGIMALLLV